MSGLFITIEGTDGSGKSTQTELLVNRLQAAGYPVEQISFPQYGQPSAAMVEAYLHGELGSAEAVGPYRASILYATDRYAASPRIRNWLEAGKIVVANRYVGSNMAHQGGKISNPIERKKYFAWIYELEYTIFGIPKPHVNLILHVPAAIAQALVDQKDTREYLRGKKRDIHEDDLNHLKDAEARYLEMAEQFPEYQVLECSIHNQIAPAAEIHEQVWQLLQPQLPTV